MEAFGYGGSTLTLIMPQGSYRIKGIRAAKDSELEMGDKVVLILRAYGKKKPWEKQTYFLLYCLEESIRIIY